MTEMVMLVAGFIETSVQNVYSDYAETKSHANITRFVSSTMQRFQNPNMQKILDMTRSFNPNWAIEIEDFSNPRVRDSINSILANRNLIAHGKSWLTSIGQQRCKQLFLRQRAEIDRYRGLTSGRCPSMEESKAVSSPQM